MNRGSDLLLDELGLAVEASMRPRFMNRGSGHGRAFRPPTASGFNEAPIHESGK